MPRFKFIMSATAEVGDDAKLRLRNPEWKIEWVRAANLTGLDISVEDLINMPLINKKVNDAIQKQFDRLPKEFSFKEQLAGVWNQVEQPQRLGKDTWLVVNPVSIGVSELHGTLGNVHATAQLDCRPVIVLGEKAKPIKKSVARFVKVPDGGSFRLAVFGKVPFSSCEISSADNFPSVHHASRRPIQ